MKVVSNLFSGILNWKFYSVIVLTSIILGYSWHESKIHEVAVQAQEEIRREVIESNLELVQEKDKVQKELSNEIQVIKTRSQANEKAITDSLNSAIKLLQQRPSRTNESSNSRDSCNAENAKGSTGITLFREDAEFLTREAARGDLIRIELESCYQQYDAVKSKLDDFKENN